MTKLSSKGRITLPKPLRDRFGLKAGAQFDFVVSASGDIVLKPILEPIPMTAQEYRRVLMAVRGSADKRFVTTDDFMRFVRG
jgi:AbrB family looped-hinge helix DNA binding protein